MRLFERRLRVISETILAEKRRGDRNQNGEHKIRN